MTLDELNWMIKEQAAFAEEFKSELGENYNFDDLDVVMSPIVLAYYTGWMKRAKAILLEKAANPQLIGLSEVEETHFFMPAWIGRGKGGEVQKVGGTLYMPVEVQLSNLGDGVFTDESACVSTYPVHLLNTPSFELKLGKSERFLPHRIFEKIRNASSTDDVPDEVFTQSF
jgi:hypothetical protein